MEPASEPYSKRTTHSIFINLKGGHRPLQVTTVFVMIMPSLLRISPTTTLVGSHGWFLSSLSRTGERSKRGLKIDPDNVARRRQLRCRPMKFMVFIKFSDEVFGLLYGSKVEARIPEGLRVWRHLADTWQLEEFSAARWSLGGSSFAPTAQTKLSSSSFL